MRLRSDNRSDFRRSTAARAAAALSPLQSSENRLCAGFGLAIFRMAGALIGALDVFSTCIGKCCFGDQTIFTGPCLVYARTSCRFN